MIVTLKAGERSDRVAEADLPAQGFATAPDLRSSEGFHPLADPNHANDLHSRVKHGLDEANLYLLRDTRRVRMSCFQFRLEQLTLVLP